MTRQQIWASEAFKLVSQYADQEGEERSKFSTYCMKMPTLMLQSGLLQAIAFVNIKCNSYVRHIFEVYRKGASQDAEQYDFQRFCREIRNPNSLAQYIAMTRDISEISIWFRRFAQSELKASDMEIVQ